MHPPESRFAKPIPEIQPPSHIEPRQSGQDHCRTRPPGEAALECFKRVKPIASKLAAPHGWQYDHGDHCNTADPDHNGEHMKRSGYDDIVHWLISISSGAARSVWLRM